MKLRTKLFLGVGLLLFAMAIIMYIVPTFFIRADIRKAADSIHNLLIKEHQQHVRSQKIWLEDVLWHTKENNDAKLLYLYDDPNLTAQLTFSEKNNDPAVWKALSHLIGYDPSIGFAQVHAPALKKSAALSPGSTTLYSIEKSTQENGLVLLSLLASEGEKEGQAFIGLPLPQEFQTELDYTLYALVNPQNAVEELAEVHEEITQLMPETVKKKLSSIVPWKGAENQGSSFSWAVKVDMIRVLTPFYAAGLAKSKKGGVVVPQGLARIDAKGHGYVVLSQEIFLAEPQFDDAAYFQKHQPTAEMAPLAYGNVILTLSSDDSAYVGNTLLVNGTYLTLASPLGMVTHQLALASNRIILLQVNQNFWLGYDAEGHQLSTKVIDQILSTKALKGQEGNVTWGDQEFYFTRFATSEEGALVFYDFRPLAEEQSIVNTLLSLEKRLSNRISMQLSLIALGTILLVLLFIGRLGFTIIYPVTQLANATQFVAAGRYGEVVLPDMGSRKDEVAILTRSFADMVRGLQDREKIRGVLDKVVSKDIADEILRTQIHLGGEDRIVTMLFGDIRKFTEFSAHFPPQKTIQVLNACMTKVSRVIEGEGGIIDKYVGDEVMALYGAPTVHPDHALRAISSGMLIIETLKKWNEERVAAGEPPVEMGIGIHTGLVMVGNMGAEDRLNYTVVGANVNLAARLCEVAKPNQLIVSAATLAEPNIEASFNVNTLPPISLKGFAEPVPIYEIISFKWEEA
ncbi:adenylate/guanylate cyclase domain-containing protein [Chlamydiota bacterium]